VKPKESHTRDMVVVRLDGLGDMMLWLSSLQHLRHSYPTRHITVMIHEPWAPYLMGLNMVDDVIPVPFVTQMNHLKRGVFYYLRLIRLLYRVWRWALTWEANMVIHPTPARTLLADVLATSIRAPVLWGVVGNHDNQWKKVQWVPGLRCHDIDQRYTHHVAWVHRTKMLSFNAHFVSEITGSRMVPRVMDLRGLTPPSPMAGPYLVWCPQAGDPGREWPLDRWEAVLSEVSDPIVLVGTGLPSPLLQAVMTRLKARGQRVLDMMGHTTVSELASIVSGASLYLGNDSGVTHIAIACGIPSVMVMGGGHSGIFSPYSDGVGLLVCHQPLPCDGCNWRCSHPTYQPGKTYPCLGLVGVQRVQDGITQLRHHHGG